jgi:putative restriction endonuclease
VAERRELYGDRPDDTAVRLAAFEFLGQLSIRYPDTIPRTVLADGFVIAGRRVPLLGPAGIFKPAIVDMPLSITTVPVVPGRPRPYEDEVDLDGRFVYRYRGNNPQHSDNVGLRQAMQRRAPLVYFVGTTPGQYVALWPAYVVGDDPRTLSFRIEVDAAAALAVGQAGDPTTVEEDRRRYVTATVRLRVHQVAFRQHVISAYREQCTVCRLRHRELLDAAHILADGDPRGLPIVPNGLALCKLHHAAFDGHILGIRPDLKIEIREDVLGEEDGPMLKHGLQGFQGTTITVPRRVTLQPNREFLEERFALFRKASAA